MKMSNFPTSSDETVEIEYDSDTFDDESIEEEFSRRNNEEDSKKVVSDNENIESEYISYESEDEVYEFSEEEFEDEDDTKLSQKLKELELGKEIDLDDLDAIDNLVKTQTQIVNEKVKKRLELVSPPKNPIQTTKEPPLDTPPSASKKSVREEKKINPLKEIQSFNETFIKEADKLRQQPETEKEVKCKAQSEETQVKPLVKERKVEIKTVAQVHNHKDGNDDTGQGSKQESQQESKQVNKYEETPCKAFEETEETEKSDVKEKQDENYIESTSPNSVEECPSDDDEDVIIVGRNCESSSDDGLDMEMRSHTPTSMRSSDYAYHLNFIRPQQQQQISCPHHGHCRPSNRKNMSFTNFRLREIERQNEILLKKILSQKPTYTNLYKKPSVPKIENLPSSRKSSAEINRKKQQRQIDLDNLVLKKKIEAISNRRSKI